MDLKNNRITIEEIFVHPRGRAIIGRNFPIIMDPFLLVNAKKMILANILKLAQGPNAQAQIEKLLADLKAI